MLRFSLGSRAIVAIAAVSLASCAIEEESTEEESLGEAEQEATVCAGDDVVHGIDVSYYQGDIDWNAVKADGWQFAITRINHSDFMDPKFDTNWAAIKEVGMIRGAYQYFEPGEDVAYQAQIVVDKLGMLGPGDLPAVIDVETTTGLGPAAVAAAVGEWLDIVEAGTGKRPIIYTGKYFWQDNVGSADYAEYPLWHAQYPNACQGGPTPPGCGCANIADQWSDWAVWQYSSTGSVAGISGNVDVNVWKGTYEDLVAFANQGGYGADLASIEAPETVLAGETFTARVTYINSGASAWDAQTKLGTTGPRDRMSPFYDPTWAGESRPAVVSGSVAPRQAYTFELTMSAPSAPGVYSESFGLVQEAVTWFADQGGPPDDAVTLSIQVIDTFPNGSGGGGSEGGGSVGGGGNAAEDGGDPPGGLDCSCTAVGTSTGGHGRLAAFGLLFALSLLRRPRAAKA